MARDDRIRLFENKRIRTAWDAEKEEWFFSIVDVVAVLTDQPDQRHAAKYWSVLKTRLKKEGSELTTKCSQLKMRSADGKRYNTDVADTEQLLRIIQSILSPKAEPFKLWLAQVGRERIEETIDPELTIDRADDAGIGSQYAGRGHDNRDFQAEGSGRFARKCRGRALRRQGRGRCTKSHRAADRRAGHYVQKRRAAQSGRDKPDRSNR